MIPRYGERVRPNKTYRKRPGAYALLQEGDSLLLTVQFGEVADIQLPGGGIDPGESPLPALHREIFEETGWRVQIQRKMGVFRRFTFMPEYDLWAEKICHIYHGRPVLRKSAPSEADHMAIFMPIAEAAQRLGNAGDRAFAGDLMARLR